MKTRITIIALALLIVVVPAMAAKVTVADLTHEAFLVYQAYPGESGQVGSGELEPFNEDLSFDGLNPAPSIDVITAVPGVLSIVPGINWANYVSAAAAGIPYTLKNVVLRKEAPEYIQCSEMFSSGVLAVQQGTPNIRLWWPLLFEVPGTTWTLRITYGTPLWDDDGVSGPNPAAVVHTDVWVWKVDATVDSLESVLDTFHEFPFGLDEVPLISDEVLYAALVAKLEALEGVLANPAPLTPAQVAAAGDILVDFEMEVADRCITDSPATPRPSGGDTGIANPECLPACCKLLVDSEFIGFDLGIFLPSK